MKYSEQNVHENTKIAYLLIQFNKIILWIPITYILNDK